MTDRVMALWAAALALNSSNLPVTTVGALGVDWADARYGGLFRRSGFEP